MKNKVKTVAKAFLWGITAIIFPVLSGVISVAAGLDVIQTLLLQGGFMVLSLVPPLVIVLCKKWRFSEIGFDKFNAEGCKKALYFIPLVLIFIPVTVSGFYFKSAEYVFCNLFLYLFVGLSEEVYFRGIVTKYLSKEFSQRGVIILSTAIFGLGHLATAFTGGGAVEVLLTVVNAFIFGALAVEIFILSGNIAVTVVLHFLFDFETKIIAMSSAELMLAEIARGTIMAFLALWLAYLIKKRNTQPKEYTEEERKKRRKTKIVAVSVISAVVFVAAVVVTSLSLYGQSQVKKIPDMTAEDCLAYTLEDCSDGVITIGVVKDGDISYTVYGKDGKELPQALHTYEIGSLTKTFTAALVEKAVADGKINLFDKLDKYFSLPEKNAYPTIAALLTHTSGYKGYYLEPPMIGNRFARRNDFCGVTDNMILDKLELLDKRRDDYPFVYSNYGYALLGLVLEKVYGAEYTSLVNDFAVGLGLANTCVSDGLGDLKNYWDWREGDAYLSAGALTSNIEDMLVYAKYQLDDEGTFANCHRVIKDIDASTKKNKLMSINMDAIGMAWLTDNENGIIWHNGATDNYNCYLGFSPQKNAAVVVLSNLPHDYRIPATVIGVKLLQRA